MSVFSAGSIIGKLSLDTTGFTGGVLQANSISAIFGPTIGAFLVNPLLGVIATAAQAASAIANIATAGLGTGIKLAADYESATIAFGTMLGSASAAEQVLGDISDFAAATPFEFPELVDAGRKLLAFGTAGDQIVPTLRMIGDVSSAIGAPIGQIAELYGKAQVQGRLFAEDINQLTGRGIPIISELAKQFGVADGAVRKLVESGQVNFGHLEAAFRSLSGEGGKFHNMMAAQSASLHGMWSTAKDNVNLSLRAIGESFITNLNIKDVLGSAIGGLDALQPAIMSIASAAGQYLGGMMGFLREQFALVMPSLTALAGAVLTSFGIALPGATSLVQGLVIALRGIVEFIVPIVIPAMYMAAAAFRVVGDVIGVILGMIGELLSAVGRAASGLQSLFGIETRKDPADLAKQLGVGGEAKEIKVDKVIVAAPTESSAQIGDKVSNAVREAAERRRVDGEGIEQQNNVERFFEEGY